MEKLGEPGLSPEAVGLERPHETRVSLPMLFFSLFFSGFLFFWAIVMVPGFVETAATVAGNVHVVFEHVKPQSGAESILPLFIR